MIPRQTIQMLFCSGCFRFENGPRVAEVLRKCRVDYEEEFAGFPEEDSTMSAKIPQFPIVLPSETDSVRRFTRQLLNRPNLEEAAIVKEGETKESCGEETALGPSCCFGQVWLFI